MAHRFLTKVITRQKSSGASEAARRDEKEYFKNRKEKL